MADDRTIMIQIGADAKAAVTELSKVTGAIGAITGAATAVTAILGGGKLFSDMIGTTKEVTAEAVKLSKAFGVTTEQASILRIALDDAFISVDDAVSASDRLTRTAIKNSAAFKQAGIDIKDHDGNLKDSMTIMMEVNDYLKTLQEGKDRDTAAMTLYGKSWRELSGILKLTSEGMKEAEDRARELHLVFGDDKVQAVKKYKMAMKDIGDVAESIKFQVGTALIPELTRLAVVFGEQTAKGIPPFILALHSIEAEFMRMAMLADKAGGSVTRLGYFVSGGKFTEAGKWWKEQNEMYRQRYDQTEKELQALANLEVGLDASGNPLKPAAAKSGNRYVPPEEKKDTGLTDKQKKAAEQIKEFLKTAWDMAAIDLAAEDFGSDVMDKLKLFNSDRLKTDKNKANLGIDTSLKSLETQAALQQALQQQQEIDISNAASLAHWEAVRADNYAAAQADANKLQAMRTALYDEGLQSELLRIEQDQQAWIQAYAMNTDSFAEYERRKVEIEQYYSSKRIDLQRKETSQKMGWVAQFFANSATMAHAAYVLSGKKSKEALVAYQVMKSGETVITTADSAMKAYDAMVGIPYIGPILAAAAAGAAIAFGAEQLQSIWSVSSDGSGGSLSGGITASGGTSPTMTQQAAPVAADNRKEVGVNVHIYGNVVDHDQFARELSVSIRKAVNDGYGIA